MLLALDLGQHLGAAWFDGRLNHSVQKCLGCTKSGSGHQSREMFECRAMGFLSSLIGAAGVAEVAFEDWPRHTGVAAAHNLGYLRGLVLAYCQEFGKPVHTYFQQTWKSAIGVKGGGKPAYISRVNELTGLALTAKEEDRASAIGIGFAHLWIQAKKGRPTSTT